MIDRAAAAGDAGRCRHVPIRLYETKLDLTARSDRRPRRQRSAAIQFYIGLDGLNIWLVVLTALLMVPSVLVSWNAISERVNEFYAWLLVLQTA